MKYDTTKFDTTQSLLYEILLELKKQQVPVCEIAPPEPEPTPKQKSKKGK